ncbi:hypothetical protein SAMN03159341_103523 [Paenibacillus sp. 1_12]|uniref:hypothetical protein n=1 Tax=Paenibacillus sp. 1_12 TaxID=1566278 RepID=UPI0008DF4587|nr:hypothetical protein [Paenibacillus sp. 1_12]SFL15614.1 hypothetical protein SAMN03159341_103523 [Paenibacillus sp. 1_12]
MVIWKGAGILTIPIVFVMIFLTMGIASIFIDHPMDSVNEHVCVGIGSILSAVPIWYAGKYYNRNKDQIYLDMKTGRQIQLGVQHSLFFIPMQFCAFVAIFIGVLALLS